MAENKENLYMALLGDFLDDDLGCPFLLECLSFFFDVTFSYLFLSDMRTRSTYSYKAAAIFVPIPFHKA